MESWDDEWDRPTLTREQFVARLDELSAEAAIAEAELVTSGMEIPYWWLSFTDPERPVGTQFLGACMVQSPTGVGAVGRAHELGINPGGQVAMAGPLEAEMMSDVYRQKWCDRLMDKPEATKCPGPDLMEDCG